jgi:hypothetical protein
MAGASIASTMVAADAITDAAAMRLNMVIGPTVRGTAIIMVKDTAIITAEDTVIIAVEGTAIIMAKGMADILAANTTMTTGNL